MTEILHTRWRQGQCCLTRIIPFVGLVVIFSLVSTRVCIAEASFPINLPLVTKNSFEYAGAFRVPKTTYGASSAAYAEGPITLGADSHSFFLVGHPYQQAIAEFSIPELSKSLNINDLNMASIIQPFSTVLDRPATGNTQNINRIGGLELVNGELIVNAYEYYDASADVTHTTLVVRDATNLEGSVVEGYHKYEARTHASGWISPIPRSYHETLGGTYIAGHSSGKPIISRHSVGPSAFVINPIQEIIGERASSSIPTLALLDFSLDFPLGERESSTIKREDYLRNTDFSNDLWVHLSRASYGFIVPGTRSYVTIGYSGGNASGVGYKITQDDGNRCGGFCSFVAADNYNYYWLWDLNDMIEVKNGQKAPHEVMPYEYGKFDAPFQTSGFNKIIGGAFDKTTAILYLTLAGADNKQSQYSPLPIIVAYELPPLSAPPAPPSGLSVEK